MDKAVQELTIRVLVDNKKVQTGLTDTKKKTGELTKSFLNANLATAALTGGFSLMASGMRGVVSGAVNMGKTVVGALSDAISYTRDFNKQTAVFGVIAKNAKTDTKAWTAEAKNIADYLGVTIPDAIGFLTPLLKSGMGAKEATALLKGFADEQVTAQDNTLSMTDKIGNLVQMYNLEMSALGNKAGLEENVSNMIKLGYKEMEKGKKSYTDRIKQIEKEGKAQGKSKQEIQKTVNAYKESMKEQAKYAGFMATMRKSQGAYNATLTPTEKLQRFFSKSLSDSRLTVGQFAVSIMDNLALKAMPAVQGAMQWVQSTLNTLISRIKAWWATNQALIEPQLYRIRDAFIGVWNKLKAFIDGIVGNQGTFDNFANTTLKEIANKAEDVALGISGVIDYIGSDEGKKAIAEFAGGVKAIGDAFFFAVSQAEKLLKLIGVIQKIGKFSWLSIPGATIVGATSDKGDKPRSSTNNTTINVNTGTGNPLSPQNVNRIGNAFTKPAYLYRA